MPEAPTPANAEVVQYFDPPATFAGDGCVPEPNGGSDEDSSGGEGKPKKVLSTALLAGLMYTLTIGGGYGIEESVMGGGPLLTLLSLILVPLFMGLPMAVVVTEMASAVPSNAGFLMWIHLTYGSMVYLVMAFLSLMLIFIDNAIYPVLFSDYVCAAVSSPCSGMQQAGLRLGIIILTYLLNLAGLEAVGVASLVLTALIVLPFPLMFVVHLFRTGFYLNWPAISTIPSTIDWATFITTVSWNLSGLEQAGAVVEQVQDPQRTILRALVPLLGLSLLTYIPPILTGASTSTGPIDLGEWTTGYWTTTASRVGGDWLMFLTVVGSALSATGLTLSALCTTTSLIAGMAHTDVFAGRLGRWLGRRSARSGAYPISLTLNMLVTAMFSIMLDFGPLVKVDQFLYGIRAVMVILAFFRLRHKYPLLPRPFVLRLTTTTRAGLYISTAAFVAVTFISLVADWETFWMCSLTLVAATLSAWLYGTYVHSGEFRGSIVTVSAREAMDPGHHPAMEEPDDDPCIFPTDSSV